MTLRSYFGKSTQPSGPLCLWRCPQIGWWSEHQNIARQSSVILRHFTFSSVMIWVLSLARIVIDVTCHWDHSTIYIEYTESSDWKRCQPDNTTYCSRQLKTQMYVYYLCFVPHNKIIEVNLVVPYDSHKMWRSPQNLHSKGKSILRIYFTPLISIFGHLGELFPVETPVRVWSDKGDEVPLKAFHVIQKKGNLPLRGQNWTDE